MNRITVSITTFGIDYDHSFAASLREQLDEAESALECETMWPASVKLSPRQLVATQAELDFKRLTELVNEPSMKPVLVVRLPWVCGRGLAVSHINTTSSTAITASPRRDFEESTSRWWW